MSDKSQIDQVAMRVDGLIDHVRKEYDLSLAEMIGILEVAKINLFMQNAEPVEGDDL